MSRGCRRQFHPVPGHYSVNGAAAHPQSERIAVEYFSLRPPRWLGLIVSRNPLVRGLDRLEALVTVVAVALAMLTLPVVAAMATESYYTQRAVYAEQAHPDRHVPSADAGASPVAIGHADPAERDLPLPGVQTAH